MSRRAKACGLLIAGLWSLWQTPLVAADELKDRVVLNVESLLPALPQLQVQLDNTTGLPATVSGLAPPASAGPLPSFPELLSQSALDAIQDNARLAVTEFFSSTGIGRQLFPTATTAAEQFVVEGVASDPDFHANSIVKVQQAIEGVPVFGAKARVVVTPTAQVSSITANFASITPPATMEPTIAREAGAAAALAERNRIVESLSEELRARLLDEEGESPAVDADLAVFDPGVLHLSPGPARLTWQVRVGSFVFFVDAVTNEVVYFFRDHQTGLLRQVYDLGGTKQFPGSLAYDDVASQVLAATPDAEAQAAYANSEIIYHYLLSEFGRQSFDALDGPVISHVRYGGFANAQWCPRPAHTCPASDVMVYGTGYSQSLDIAGHELIHGLIAAEADLVYVNESGALNEALADVIGVLISRSAGDDDWHIGEDLPGHSNANPVRSVEQPTMGGFVKAADFSATNRGQPDHYSNRVTTFDRICASTTDVFNGCVHINSGIINRALFLMSEGGSQFGVAVQGIGAKKVGRIVYRALTTKLVPTSIFADMARTSLEACLELTATQVTVPSDCEQVSAAFAAVGLPGPTPLLMSASTKSTDLSPLQFTAEQAAAGGVVYAGRCGGCHGGTLLGGFGPPLRGPIFRANWYEGSVGALHDFVRTRMPKLSPGTLSPEDYLHLVAFIVQSNDASPGDQPLPDDAQLLAKMGFYQPPTPPVAASSQP